MRIIIFNVLNFVFYIQAMEENLARASQKNIDVWAGNEVESRHRLEDLERELKTVQVWYDSK